MRLFDRFRWRGTEQVYELPWLRNRVEYTADPARIEEFTRCPYTRSKLTRDMLARFHLSHNSIVVSDDDHAKFMRARFFEHVPEGDVYPRMARSLVDAIFEPEGAAGPSRTISLSPTLIREVYKDLLANLMGIEVTEPIRDYIQKIDFKPGRRPMHLNGLMYAFSQLLPGSTLLRHTVDFLFYKGERYTRQVATELEEMIFRYAVPKPNSWYADLLKMKESRAISNAQFRGELTSAFVSAYSLASALSSMMLCLAVRPQYFALLREKPELKKCFVYEVLRLYPPFRQFGYERAEGAEKGDERCTDLMVAVYALQRNQAAWGDSMVFRPERFLERGAMGGHKFMPFGIGKRYCSGRTYSMGLLVETLACIVSEDCGLELSVPDDFVSDESGLPVGVSGRLISFPVDDRLRYQRLPKVQDGSSRG